MFRLETLEKLVASVEQDVDAERGIQFLISKEAEDYEFCSEKLRAQVHELVSKLQEERSGMQLLREQMKHAHVTIEALEKQLKQRQADTQCYCGAPSELCVCGFIEATEADQRARDGRNQPFTSATEQTGEGNLTHTSNSESLGQTFDTLVFFKKETLGFTWLRGIWNHLSRSTVRDVVTESATQSPHSAEQSAIPRRSHGLKVRFIKLLSHEIQVFTTMADVRPTARYFRRCDSIPSK